MDRLGEIVRLNDDKLYSQLINYKYRAKGAKKEQAASKGEPDDEDGLEDKENKTNQDNQSSQSSSDTNPTGNANGDWVKNESLRNRHHHRHRKNRLKGQNAKARDNVDKKTGRAKWTNRLRRIQEPARSDGEPVRIARVNRLDRNSVNSIKSRFDENRLVIDLEPVERSNQTNEDLIRDNGLSDDMQDYLDLIGNGNGTMVEERDNEIKNEVLSDRKDKSEKNLTRTEESDEFKSIEIINLSVDEMIDSQTNHSVPGESDLALNVTDNLKEYLDENSLLSSASNQLLLNELNQTDWQLSNDERSLRRIAGNNESLLDQDDLINLTRTNADSNEGFLYELDLLDGNAALLSELIDFGDSLIDERLTNRSDLADRQFINQQLISDNKLISQHNRLIDNQFVDQSHPKFSHLIGDAGGGGNLNAANLTTILAATVATLTNKMLLNLSAPNQLFTPNLILNTTSAYTNASLMLSPTTKPPTPAPFPYWLTILIAVLIAIASIITIVGNLMVNVFLNNFF